MHKKYPVRLVFAGLLAVAIACWGNAALAQSNAALEQRIRMITERPEFAHSRFGIKFIAADTGNVVYELNSAQLFVPGSTTKLLTEGTALELFGGDYRFHTKIYRTDSEGWHAARRPGAGGERRFEPLESHSGGRLAGV